MILRKFISLQAFTVYMENSLLFEISLRSNWNLHWSEFHYARSHVNSDNEVTAHRSEILPRSEISNRFGFTSDLMQTCSNFAILFSLEKLKEKMAIFKKCNFFDQACFLHSGNQVFAYHAYIFPSCHVKNYLYVK